MVTGRGLIILPGLRGIKANIGDKLRIVRPDKTVVETEITGIGFKEHQEILVTGELSKDDVPIRFEVWSKA